MEQGRQQGSCGGLIEPVSRDSVLLPSHSQERIWFVEQLSPGESPYKYVLPLRMKGRLLSEAMDHGIAELVSRHESLRTRFEARNGEPVQVVDPPTVFAVQHTDLTLHAAQAGEREVERIVTEEVNRPLDLARSATFRARLIRLSPDDHVLVLVIHHIAADGVSMGILMRELEALYLARVDGRPSPLAELPIQYADYAHWERQRVHGDRFASQLHFWRAQLADLTRLQLPTDRSHRSAGTGRSEAVTIMLPPALSSQLQALTRKEKATRFMALFAAYVVLLSRWSGQEDIAVGTLVANRAHHQARDLIGCFFNTVVLRVALNGGESFSGLLKRVKDAAVRAYANQNFPFEKLVAELQPERDLSRQPLFQALFSFRKERDELLVLPGVTVSIVPCPLPTARADLFLELVETPSGISGMLKYNGDLFDRATAERLAGHYSVLLEDLVNNPDSRIGDLRILTPAERDQIVVKWNDTQTAVPDRCIHVLFEDQARSSPSALAAEFEGRQLTYGELNAVSNQLGRHLRSLGVGPDTRVAICVERSLEMIIGLLGILKAGGAYVPLDPELPFDRLISMLDDTAASVLLTQGVLRRRFNWPVQTFDLDSDLQHLRHLPTSDPEPVTAPNHLVYCIFTSGSTGVPKAVATPHSALVNYALFAGARFHVRPGARYAICSPIFSDLGNTPLYVALLHAGSVHLAPPDAQLGARDFASFMRKSRIDFLKITPSHLASLAAESEELEELLPRECLVFGGEGLPAALLDRVRHCARQLRIFNHYGPTETTVGSLIHRADEAPAFHSDVIPLGRPIANTQLYILDRWLNPVPVGGIGEIHIAGAGLARGYLNRPQLTAEKFVACPFAESSGRMYRTGDLGRYRPDGSIEFHGRADDQAKIRGFRVEPGEIEQVLMGHPSVRAAAVTVRRETAGAACSLVAHVVLENPAAASLSQLRNYLQKKLPAYMIPADWVFLPSLPLNPNGKLDRRALAQAPGAVSRVREAYVPPRTPTEHLLASIWADVLRVDHVGLNDDFFALGGHSLLATQAVARIADRTSISLPVRALFDAPTLRALARHIDQRATSDVPPAPPILRRRNRT